MPQDDQASIVDELVARFDHLDPRISHDVLYELYGRFAQGCPVPHTEAHGGFSLITRYADLVEVEKQATTFSSADGVLHPPHSDRPRAIPIEFDPPKHTEYRALFMDVLSVPRVRDFEPRLRPLIDQVVDDYRSGSDPDFVERVAIQIPIQAVVQLLGCEPEISRDFQDLGEEVLRTFGTPEMTVAFEAFGRLVHDEIESRRVSPREDYLTALTQARVNGQPLTEDELQNILRTFAFAGFETTARTIATMVHHLAQHPDLQDRLRAEPELRLNVIEESLRVFPPIHTMFRTATCPADVDGAHFEPGDRVALLFAATNLDSSVFESPNEFRPDRSNARRHLAFGVGPHFCAGAALARAEIRVLLDKLAELPNYEIDGEARYLPSLAMGQVMGIDYLPIKFADA